MEHERFQTVQKCGGACLQVQTPIEIDIQTLPAGGPRQLQGVWPIGKPISIRMTGEAWYER